LFDINLLQIKIADWVQELKSKYSTDISVTGIINEPKNTFDYFAQTVIDLRQKLNAAGLSKVPSITPESPSADNTGLGFVKQIRSNQEAWNDLKGIASHSYNMAANADWASIVINTTKDYWITEAGASGGADYGQVATTLAARFLNDLNHHVTHWVWFIGIFSRFL